MYTIRYLRFSIKAELMRYKLITKKRINLCLKPAIAFSI